jgi:hypothetical protein
MNKSQMRARLAALSFSEKIKILEKVRDRSLALAAAGLRKKAARPAPQNADAGSTGSNCIDPSLCSG